MLVADTLAFSRPEHDSQTSCPINIAISESGLPELIRKYHTTTPPTDTSPGDAVNGSVDGSADRRSLQ